MHLYTAYAQLTHGRCLCLCRCRTPLQQLGDLGMQLRGGEHGGVGGILAQPQVHQVAVGAMPVTHVPSSFVYLYKRHTSQAAARFCRTSTQLANSPRLNAGAQGTVFRPGAQQRMG